MEDRETGEFIGSGFGQTYQDEQPKTQFSDRAYEIHDPHWLRERGDARSDEQVRNDKQCEDDESADPHRPREADFSDKPRNHDREEDAAEG